MTGTNKKPRIRESYVSRCKNYVLWLCAPLYTVDEYLPDSAPGAYNAVEAMFMLETHGKEVTCSEPRMFDALKKGKQSREFHIKGWLSMTRANEALPEEFFGCLGLRSREEFRGIFGRMPSLPTLHNISRNLSISIRTFESMLSN